MSIDLRKIFNDVIEDYNFARPNYPDQMYRDIIQFSVINKMSKILEVGSGTGQSTNYYALGDYDITALEIGDKQIELLEKKYKNYQNVKILQTPFETFKSEIKFNLIFSATAFHWIKPEVRYVHSHDLLEKDGTLSVYWVTSLNRQIDSDIHVKIQEICRECLSGAIVFYPDSYFIRFHQYRLNEMKSNGFFTSPDYRVYRWSESYSAKRYVALINTFEYIQVLAKEQRNNLLIKIKDYISEHGDCIIIPQQVELYLMKKK